MQRIVKSNRKQTARLDSTVTSLAEIMTRLQDQLQDDAKVIETVARMSNQGRLRRVKSLDLAA